jgi:hypothetical protein
MQYLIIEQTVSIFRWRFSAISLPQPAAFSVAPDTIFGAFLTPLSL